MNQALRVLLVQKPDSDATMVLKHLSSTDSRLMSLHMDSIPAFKQALEQNHWDVVIALLDTIQFFYEELLALIREAKLEIPLILIVPEINASVAIRALKAGVSDIVTKDELSRLVQSIEHEINIAKLRQQQKNIDSDKHRFNIQYQALFENAVVGIFQTTPDGHYITANPALAKLLGYQSVSQMLALVSNIEQQLYVNPQRRREFIEQIQQQDSVSKFESQVYRRDGKVIWILENARTVRDEWGNLLYYEGFVEDITESRQAQGAFKRAKQDLELCVQQKTTELEGALNKLQHTQMQLIQTEKMSSLGQLVAGIAHEINNPINFIYNNLNFASEYTSKILDILNLYEQLYPNPKPEIQALAQVIELEYIKEDLPKILSSMQTGTDRICEIILGLRNFSRMEKNIPEIVDIHTVIDSVILILQHRFKPNGNNPGIKIIKEYGKLPLIKCYPGQLNQVFMNLIANAIDALEETLIKQQKNNSCHNCMLTLSQDGVHQKNKINFALSAQYQELNANCLNEVTHHNQSYQKPLIRIITQVSEEKSSVVIRIADNGIGIAKDNQKQIFNEFFTTKPAGKGTGLGLSISQKIIFEKHRGILWCNSEPGNGTEFWIEIPINGDI